MAKRKNVSLVTCPYCRKQLRHCDSERDHIPPKSLFPSPRPSDLLTVRCCPQCHDEFSIGDEPLKALGGLGVFRNVDAHRIKDEIYRGLGRNPWWKQNLIDSAAKMDSVDLVVGSNIVRLPKIQITGDVAVAIKLSLKRTVVGLLYDWDAARVVSLDDVEIVQVPEENPQILERVFGDMPLRRSRVIGDAFRAVWDFANDSPTMGAMILSFYEGLHFVAFLNVPDGLISDSEFLIDEPPPTSGSPTVAGPPD